MEGIAVSGDEIDDTYHAFTLLYDPDRYYTVYMNGIMRFYSSSLSLAYRVLTNSTSNLSYILAK